MWVTAASITDSRKKEKGTPAVGLTDLDSRIESNIRKLRTEVIIIKMEGHYFRSIISHLQLDSR